MSASHNIADHRANSLGIERMNHGTYLFPNLHVSGESLGQRLIQADRANFVDISILGKKSSDSSFAFDAECNGRIVESIVATRKTRQT